MKMSIDHLDLYIHSCTIHISNMDESMLKDTLQCQGDACVYYQSTPWNSWSPPLGISSTPYFDSSTIVQIAKIYGNINWVGVFFEDDVMETFKTMTEQLTILSMLGIWPSNETWNNPWNIWYRNCTNMATTTNMQMVILQGDRKLNQPILSIGDKWTNQPLNISLHVQRWILIFGFIKLRKVGWHIHCH